MFHQVLLMCISCIISIIQISGAISEHGETSVASHHYAHGYILYVVLLLTDVNLTVVPVEKSVSRANGAAAAAGFL